MPTAVPEVESNLDISPSSFVTSTDTKEQVPVVAPDDQSKSYFPLASCTTDGWSNEREATATCFCGAVQLNSRLHATHGEGLVGTFICACTDCHKITGSMFASNFAVADTHLEHLRGQSNLTAFSQSRTVASGNTMTNYFCSTCGTLMYRVSSGFPGMRVMRVGTVDDFHLQETKLSPKKGSLR
ncbi:Mss4-like protein [Mycena olivaceomarginata]|nr:Mss4-like protein [Mycena olivaceomarginata]